MFMDRRARPFTLSSGQTEVRAGVNHHPHAAARPLGFNMTKGKTVGKLNRRSPVLKIRRPADQVVPGAHDELEAFAR
jgi:hypothetical protein